MSLAQVWQDAVSGRSSGLSTGLLMAGLRVLAPLYGLGASVHRGIYARGVLPRHRLGCPVLSVGNITMGGTGKTSAVLFLARALLDRGVRPAILFRGHRRTQRQAVILSGGRCEGDAVGAVGDEASMAAQMLPEAVVAAGKRRRAVAEQVLGDTDAGAIILDDGFQYHPLRRDLDIVLVDALWVGRGDRVFPAGTLRERLHTLRRADAIWLTHVDVADDAARAGLWRLIGDATGQASVIETSHEPVLLRRPGGDATRSPEDLRELAVGAVSSIGNPLAFERGLERIGAAEVRPLRFPDHHRYTSADGRAIAAFAGSVDMAVTTEKDAVRLPEAVWESENLWILRSEMQFARGGEEAMRMVDQCLLERR